MPFEKGHSKSAPFRLYKKHKLNWVLGIGKPPSMGKVRSKLITPICKIKKKADQKDAKEQDQAGCKILQQSDD